MNQEIVKKINMRFKIAHFLLGLSYGSKRLFFRSRYDAHAYQFFLKISKLLWGLLY